MTCFRTATIVTAGMFLLCSQTLAQGLTVTVDPVRSSRGTLIALVFDDAEAFEYLAADYAVGFTDQPARKGTMTLRFPDLTKGPYAVFVFHDENGDQDLNYTSTRFLEGIGATGAPNPTDLPGFAEAAVRPGQTSIVLHYPD